MDFKLGDSWTVNLFLLSFFEGILIIICRQVVAFNLFHLCMAEIQHLIHNNAEACSTMRVTPSFPPFYYKLNQRDWVFWFWFFLHVRTISNYLPKMWFSSWKSAPYRKELHSCGASLPSVVSRSWGHGRGSVIAPPGRGVYITRLVLFHLLRTHLDTNRRGWWTVEAVQRLTWRVLKGNRMGWFDECIRLFSSVILI